MTNLNVINDVIAAVREKMPEGRIAEVFENCYSNTITKTLKQEDDGTCFIITGDIHAMWLRDSACQVRPYVFLAKEHEEVAELIEGVIRRQAMYVNLDPYANAFNEEADGSGHQDDKTEMNPQVFERKYEIDSLCFPLQLSHFFWKTTGSTKAFDESWHKMAENILQVFTTEQYHESRSAYRFERFDCPPTDTLVRDGLGAPVKDGIGLIWSGFRPSDDACTYGYLIPSNMFAVTELAHMAEILRAVYGDEELAARAEKLSAEVHEAIEKYAVINRDGKEFYAYEVDGLGNQLVMDDANLPSLLSSAFFGYIDPEDEKYKNTREVILSKENPFFFEGSALRGIGSPHTPNGNVWDISLAMEGLTTDDRDEQRRLLEVMVANDAGTGMMHESINCNDPADFTRPWFSWANAVFSELVLHYIGIIK